MFLIRQPDRRSIGTLPPALTWPNVDRVPGLALMVPRHLPVPDKGDTALPIRGQRSRRESDAVLIPAAKRGMVYNSMSRVWMPSCGIIYSRTEQGNSDVGMAPRTRPG